MRIALALVAAALALSAAASSPAQVAPPQPATSFTAVLSYAGGSELVSWQAPESLAVRRLSGEGMLGGTFARAGRVYYRYSASSPVSLLTGTFAALPDAPSLLAQLQGSTGFALAQARGGTLKLRPAGADAWQVKLFAPANKCAGFGSGTIELRLRRADLLPLRVFERHGAVVAREFRLAYRSVGEPLPAATFAVPKTGSVDYRESKGFVRSSPAAAARHLSYTPLLPQSVPAGFALAVSGWAKRSAATGAEGSIPPARDLFAAVYRRGAEEIDVTQRLAPAGGWASDPFGAECVRQLGGPAAIGAATATYGASPNTIPHLYWRSGKLLYTVSGPFPKAQLAAIARSLQPIS